ncbi:hypothetical protein GQR58_020874 [Nymphon striatum]|nr:hypothetical protein GQR58_020874 [Nymphon striatum]
MVTKSRDKIATAAEPGKQAHDWKLKLTRNTKMSENPKIFIFETFFKGAYSVKRAQQYSRRITQKLLKDIESRLNSETSVTSSGSSSESPRREPGHCVQASVDGLTDSQDDNAIWEEIDEQLDRQQPSSSESDDNVDKVQDFRNRLAEWAISGNIALTSVTKLLKILRMHNIDVPAQATTLLQTPRDIVLSRKSGGDYVYMGLEKGIKLNLSSVGAIDSDIIELSFNIDGIPIYRSKNCSMWPIQCQVVNVPSARPFVVALYSASHKPQDVNFLEDFVGELRELMQNGISVDGGLVKTVVVRCFVCDAPAKALVKGIIQYNGRYGCDYCDVRGDYDGRMLFLQTGNLRTNRSFRERENVKHHKIRTPLEDLDIDMIRQFPIDPMHCVDLGVTKKLMLLWKEGPRSTRLSAGHLNAISAYLCSIKPFMPPAFNRKPRGLEEIKMWKATEFRTFLMYTGPVVLKNILSSQMYKHFMCLSVAVCILYNAKLVSKHRLYAHELLTHFVEKSRDIYSDKFLTYNVHCLCHLADVAKEYQSLENCTAYPFENYNSTIKRSVRGTGNPVVQVSRRLVEMALSPLLSDANATVKKNGFKKGACCKLKNNKYCTLHEIRHGGKVLCEIYTRTQPFYSSPCDSRILGIHKVMKTNTEMQMCDIQDIDSCAIYIPLSLFDSAETNTAVVIPMMHSL